jgi:DNA-binding SARP family transcriptional activator
MAAKAHPVDRVESRSEITFAEGNAATEKRTKIDLNSLEMASSTGPTFRVLGHLEVGNGEPRALGGRKQRALLVYLLLHAGKPVSTDTLVDALWSEQPPSTASAVVYTYMRKLRLALEGTPASITTETSGYRLAVSDDELDLRRFELLARGGKDALHAGEAETAARLLGEALALWRGPALAELGDEQSAEAARGRLGQARLDATFDRIDAELAGGRQEQVVPELTQLVAENPYEERLRAQLMLALYRSGRHAEALDAYREARTALREELGLEPSPALRRLEQAILRHDPELVPPRHGVPFVPGRPRQSRKTRTAVAATIVLLAGATVGFVLTRGSGANGILVRPNSVAVLDATSGVVVADIPVGRDPIRVAVGARAVWAINRADKTLSRISPASLKTRVFGLPAAPSGLAVGPHAVWVANGQSGSVSMIDPATGFTRTILLGAEPSGRSGIRRYASAVAIGRRSVWVANGSESAGLTILNGSGGGRRLRDWVPPPGGPNALAVSNGAAWSFARGVLTRVDLRSHTETTVQIGVPLPEQFGGSSLPMGLAGGNGGIWAANPYDGLVEVVNPQTGGSVGTVHVPGRPESLAAGGGQVWAAGIDGDVTSIDVATTRVRRTMQLGHPATSVAVGYGRVWVAVAGP